MKNLNPIITVAVALVVGGLAFYGGIMYQKSKTPQFQTARNADGGNQRFGGQRGQGGSGGQFFRPVIGDILSKDDKTITVKLMDGSSKIVFYTQATSITKTDTGNVNELTLGQKVGVFGMSNSDGSVTAQSIQINPIFGMRPSPSTTPTPAVTQ